MHRCSLFVRASQRLNGARGTRMYLDTLKVLREAENGVPERFNLNCAYAGASNRGNSAP
jgi:hypothetical protein